MRLYSVYLRDHGRDPARDLMFVKEGFSWPAFAFTFLWALASRMWWEAMALFAVVALAGWGVAQFGLSEGFEAATSLGLACAIGLVGNDLRRAALDRRGFQEVAVVSGRNADEAMRRFLDDADVSAAGIYP